MYAVDFIYDNVALSDFNFVINNFEQAGLEIRDVGSKITLNLTSSSYGKNYDLAGTAYDTCLTCQFDICKDPNVFDRSEMAITSDEYRDIVRWLNRREFCQMQFICSDEDYKEMPYYNATFNTDKLVLGEYVYGIRLTMQTDSPFGHLESNKINLTIENGKQSYSNEAIRYKVESLDLGAKEVNTSYSSDLNMMASPINTTIAQSYGVDGNGLNYVGDINDLTMVPKYDYTSSEVKYKAETVSYSSTMDADEMQLLGTDETSSPTIVYKEYDIAGRTGITGTITTLTPSYTSSTSNGVVTRVYENVLSGNLQDSETFMCSFVNCCSYSSYRSDFSVKAYVYGTVNDVEQVVGEFKTETTNSYYSSGYYISGGLKIRTCDILPWLDKGVYRIRVVVTYRASGGSITNSKFTKLSLGGPTSLNLVADSSNSYGWNDGLKSVGSNRQASSYTNKLFSLTSGAYPLMFSDGLLWYHVFDTEEVSDASWLSINYYRSQEFILTSGKSVNITNVFKDSNTDYGAVLVRKVTNGSNTYTEKETLGVDHSGRYYAYGPISHSYSAVPSSYNTSGNITNTYYQNAIGKGSDTANTSNNDYCTSDDEWAYVYYYFDLTSIPSGSTIESMSLTVKGHCESTSSHDSTQYFGCVLVAADGTELSEWHEFTSETDTVATLSLKDIDWTLDILSGAYLKVWMGYYGGAVSGATWLINYKGTPYGLVDETRSIVTTSVNYDDDFFSNYGNTYTKSAYIEYYYDTGSTLYVQGVANGTPVGTLNGSGGGNYDDSPLVYYDSSNTYAAYAYKNYVYLDGANGYIYISDGILWHKQLKATNLYIVTEKLPINDNEVYSAYIKYLEAEKNRNLYILKGVDNSDMEVGSTITFSAANTELYGKATTSIFSNYTSGQRYIQFRIPYTGIASNGITITKASASTSALSSTDIIIGYNTSLGTSIYNSISSTHIVGRTITYLASNYSNVTFINTYNRCLYYSDGKKWYYYMTVQDSGKRTSLSISTADIAILSCGANFSSSQTSSGYFIIDAYDPDTSTLYDSYTSTATTITSASATRYSVDCTTGAPAAFLLDVSGYELFVRYAHDTTSVTSGIMTIIYLSDGNRGLVTSNGVSWNTGQYASIGDYAANNYAGYLCLDSTSENLYFSDGAYWFYLMGDISEGDYATSSIAVESGDIITFSLLYAAAKTFTITKVEYGVYHGKTFYNTTAYSFTDTTSGTCTSTDSTFTVDTYTVNRDGVYFIFPWLATCTYTVTKILSGTPVGILTGRGGASYNGHRVAYSGTSSTYRADDYKYYFYIDKSNNYMYMSDGVFWHYIKASLAGSLVTSDVSIEKDEIVLLHIVYAHKKSFNITKVITAKSDAYSASSITQQHLYHAYNTREELLMVRYDDTELSRYGQEFSKTVQFLYPYESDATVTLKKICLGESNGLINISSDMSYVYNYENDNGDTYTYFSIDKFEDYPAETYYSYICYNNKNGNIYISDGDFWVLIRNLFEYEDSFYISEASLTSSILSNGNRTIKYTGIGNDVIIFNLIYSTETDFTVSVTRGLTNISGSTSTMTYNYTDATQAILQIRPTDNGYIDADSEDEKYVEITFSEENAQWRITKVTTDSDDESKIIHGYDGTDYDGSTYVVNGYITGSSSKLYATNNIYAAYVDDANGYIYISDGLNWHYLERTNIPYYQDTISDYSDEIGYSYPDVVVTIEEDGRYVLQNVEFGTSTEINNCVSGEVITMHGKTQTIESSLYTHDIAKDFNFEFLRIGNTYESRINTIKYCLPATTTIYHTPLIKDLT